MPKKITVSCCGPIALGKRNNYEVPWEDVYLSWSGKPKGKKYRIAPVIVSKTDAEHEYKLLKELQEENPDYDFSEEINILENALKHIKEYNQIYIHDPNDPLCAIYTPKEYIDRKEAERMIRELMVNHYGFNEIICKWKRPRLVILPT